MNDQTMSEILTQVDAELRRPALESMPVALPARVEAICSAWNKQFNNTADRAENLADGLLEIVTRLRAQAAHLREQSMSLPDQMRQQVTYERESETFVAFYEPILSMKL